MQIHVISFDVPWPADYGGVIDVYNRLQALNENGINVILHTFHYGRHPAEELNNICSEVHYYKRKSRFWSLFSQQPMIVRSRRSEKLLKALLKDENAILFEGQHTTGLLNHPKLKERKKLVRIHNIEHEYYYELSNNTKNWLKNCYFLRESRKLKNNESVLKAADQLLCITQKDTDYYDGLFGNARFLPVALKCEKRERTVSNKAPFCLYHGNLSVPENQAAVSWLLEHICSSMSRINVVFAGRNPPVWLKKKMDNVKNVKWIENPSSDEMDTLIDSTAAHVLYTPQSTGIKIKLLNALCSEAPVFCNSALVKGTGLEKACEVHDDTSNYREALIRFLEHPNKDHLQKRKELLSNYDFSKHAGVIIEAIENVQR
jgi:hypothetical protein